MKIIVGLGNPSDKYKKTRHNIGFDILDWYLKEPKWQENKKFNSLTYEEGGNLYIKPQTYMNKSGEAVSKALHYFKLTPKTWGLFQKKDYDLSDVLIVIHDDLDIELGKIKISENSSSAGHKGVSSIISHIKTKNFIRIRIGIKKPLTSQNIPTEKYVLSKLKAEEFENIKTAWNNLKPQIQEKTGL
ncbi:aminoacyl-tRNA hydrolase [Patescibacteria group bacterium]|nr:aminoacyl-tRNA hydrolase [Patescibacteria group bacterium]